MTTRDKAKLRAAELRYRRRWSRARKLSRTYSIGMPEARKLQLAEEAAAATAKKPEVKNKS